MIRVGTVALGFASQTIRLPSESEARHDSSTGTPYCTGITNIEWERFMLQAAGKGKMLVPAVIEIVTSGRLMSSRESVELCVTTDDA